MGVRMQVDQLLNDKKVTVKNLMSDILWSGMEYRFGELSQGFSMACQVPLLRSHSSRFPCWITGARQRCAQHQVLKKEPVKNRAHLVAAQTSVDVRGPESEEKDIC